MATKKAGGSTQNNRDSESKRLGVKRFGGEQVRSGNIIIRQRGTPYRAGAHVGVGVDHTLYALTDGTVHFTRKGRVNHKLGVIRKGSRSRLYVNVRPISEANAV